MDGTSFRAIRLLVIARWIGCAGHRARTGTVIASARGIEALCELRLLLPNPIVPQGPAHGGTDAAPAYNRHGAHPVLDDADKTADKDDDRADMLHNDSGVGHKRPKVVWPYSWVSL